ncbi:hydroxamate-type ferrisiderophore receptor [Ameyamaea chiangmaiensis NBRC 103196]|uniref:TonB-dependent siderophore receptor n=1 Tax=Ameyamaea chiangmaiensis TaxID=442969 RepID=A0A850PEH6_9PROT|nr:TonB-dependent siderophore receptor [Ameyamaea chiangmaiensis]MBS4074777.1 TonB-dependent siderophore receptor [Ameyamaea chiangmaiensis]NVN40342.1 TonB-dependent siderophore receptor [Ameyamaea chiangmaiensis]GBQ62703.1 hydroxamate-type ferrisiderophore receptor [Ameyamaea chiangmaiensis NBRC 103196]
MKRIGWLVLLSSGLMAPNAGARAADPSAAATDATPFLEPPTEEVNVRGARRHLLAGITTAATKTATPIEDTPQNVTVITQGRLALLNSRSVSDAVRYASGVSDYGSKDDPRGYFGTIRGFSPDIYLDGTRTPDAASSQSFSIEPWGLEEIDVLRGATSALYGSGQLGGIINAVSKRPRADMHDEVQIQTGSYNRVQGAADIGGALDGDRTWLWRFNGLIRKSDTYAKNILNNEIYVAPSVRWAPDSRTDVTFLASFEQLDAGSTAQFLPAQGTVFATRYGRIARSFLSSDADFDVYSKRQAAVGYALRRQITPNWTITQNMRYAHLDLAYRFVTANALQANLRTLTRQALLQSGNYNNVTLDTRSEVTFHTGPVGHDILFGVDFRSDFIASRRGQGAAPSIDLYAPVYRRVTWPTYANRTNSNETETQTGVYAQEQADWHRFHLTLSGRGDFTQSLTVNNINGVSTPQKNNAFTGRAGLLYQSAIGLAPYAAYSTSFQPQVGVTRLNAPFVPTRGRQVEAGVKYRPPQSAAWGSDILLTADVFTLTETNVLTTDPVDSTYSIQTGAQRTRGLELEGLGRLPGKVDVIASFTWQDPRITKTTVAAQLNQRPVVVPSHMASLFLARDVRLTPAWTVGLGGGVRYTGNTAGSLPETFAVPSQLVWDLEAHADYRKLRVQFNGTNITDRKYVAICTRSVACAWAPGRAAFVTLSYRF